MVKINIEYTIIDTNLVKFLIKIKEEESTTAIEKIVAEVTKTAIEGTIKDSQILKENNIEEILNSIGKEK